MNKIKSVIGYVVTSLGGLVILGIIFWVGSEVQQTPPDELVVLADHKYKTYISPECLNPNINYESEDFEPVGFSYAVEVLEYDYESECTYNSIFPSRSTAWDFIGTRLGIIKPLNWKWNENGSWKKEAFE